MKERPILFSGAMVRAILSGAKTQTRRVVKPQPPIWHAWSGWCVTSTHRADEGKATWAAGTGPFLRDVHRVACPYGQPGDRLYVRETWQPIFEEDTGFCGVRYASGGCPEEDKRAGSYLDGTNRWRPSIHMPRWASRLTLEITGVRVERLQAISAADAMEEGVAVHADHFNKPIGHPCSPVMAYRDLWEFINGPGSWDANPWVWVVEFRRIDQ